MRSELRLPQIRVALGGDVLPGIISAEIDSNNHFSADRFRLRFVASVVPQDILHIPGVELEIEFGLHGQWVTSIVGLIDSVRFDPTYGVVDVEGRDLSSGFIEAQIDETFANRTASEIAMLFASRHGLLALADPTTTPIGRYYQSEHDRSGLGQFAKTATEWDLLASLATREGFDLYMAGRVLRFGFPLVTGATEINLSDCVSLQLSHCIGLARPIDVLVRSWNSKTAVAVEGRAYSPGVGPLWERRIARPNLTAADAQSQAERVASDLKRHEWSASLTMPGELALSARSVVIIRGAGKQTDLLYSISNIARHFDVKRGFTQSLSLRGIV